MMAVGLVENISNLAHAFGCRVDNFPITCLGLPLGEKYLSKTMWDIVIERIETRL